MINNFEIDEKTMKKIQSVYNQLQSKGLYPVDEMGEKLTVEGLAKEHIRIKNSDSHKKATKRLELFKKS